MRQQDKNCKIKYENHGGFLFISYSLLIVHLQSNDTKWALYKTWLSYLNFQINYISRPI